MPYSFRLILLMVSIGLFAGCRYGTEFPGKQKVDGTVTWNGSPLPEGTVTFFTPEGGMDSASIKAGRFSIYTNPGPKVISVMAERNIGTPAPTPDEPNPSAVMFQYLPKEWNVESKLKEEIRADTTTLNLELTGTERKPPKIP